MKLLEHEEMFFFYRETLALGKSLGICNCEGILHIDFKEWRQLKTVFRKLEHHTSEKLDITAQWYKLKRNQNR